MMQPDSAIDVERVTDATRLCPKCHTVTARLFSVALKQSERTLSYQCTECKLEWSVVDFSPNRTRAGE